jgi:hypothetical protein
VRVRAWSSNQGIGDWSLVLDAQTGTAAAEALTPGAATNPISTVENLEFLPLGGYVVDEDLVADADSTGDLDIIRFGFTSITTIGGIVLPFILVKVNYKLNQGDSYRMIIRRDELAVFDTGEIETKASWTTLRQDLLRTFSFADAPPEGTYIYAVEIRVTGSAATNEIRVMETNLQLVELRR